MSKQAVSENGLKVLEYLKEHEGENMTAADVADALGMEAKSVNPIITSGLIGTKEPKKNLVERVPATIQLEDGTPKAVKFVRITEAGKAYDHQAALAADAAALAASQK